MKLKFSWQLDMRAYAGEGATASQSTVAFYFFWCSTSLACSSIGWLALHDPVSLMQQDTQYRLDGTVGALM